MIIKLCQMLDMLKGISTGWSSKCDNSIIMDFDGKRYLVDFTEIKIPSEDIFEDINKYLP